MLDSNSLPAPHPNDHPDNKMWVDEQIWGHRLWDAQSPWLIFLEFLTVAEACHREGRLLDDHGKPYPLAYRPGRRIYLRNILYNSDSLLDIARRFPDSATAWRHWLESMQDNAKAVKNRDFSFLKSRFASFQEFAALVAMLRSTTVESGSNKRWSSRFVFPFGPHAIYEDLNISAGSASREYIYFGLPGELLYQMLTRSSEAPALRQHLASELERSDPCDRLIALMQPDDTEDLQLRGNSYLPYARHSCFDALAQDWRTVFELSLPRFDSYPHLTTLTGLHLALYQLTVAAEFCGDNRPTFICEVVAPRKTLVRELSVMSYLRNNQLPARAVEEFVRRPAADPAWQAAAADPASFPTCLEILRNAVRWPRTSEDYDGPADADALIAALRKAALARHRQHVAQVHRAYGGGAGLVSRRGTTRLRYAPTDDLLRALIIANVPVRMEFGEFLSRLFQRYGLVFGDREAREALAAEEFDKRAFQSNSERLESRLRTLGMLRRLSDACAYVENPFRRSAP